MGIEIHTKAVILRRGLWKRLPGRDTIFNDIQSSIESFISDPLFQKGVRYTTYQHTLLATLCPMGDLELTWEPDGSIAANTKTSVVGPGYHAFVIELLQKIGEQCNLKWDWRAADDADYVFTQDFDTLQNAMGTFLQNMAKSIFQYASEDRKSLAINWPILYPTVTEESFAISPSGPWPRTWWEELANAKNEQLINKYQEFYPWWNRDMDALFWRNYGLVLLCSEVNWHPPANPEEEKLYQLTIDCFQKAKNLNPQIEIPQTEIEELETLLNTNPEIAAIPPQEQGIGFRRRIMTFRTTANWTIDVPGYYYHDWEEEEGTALFWFNNRTIRVSSLRIETKGKSEVSVDELLPEKNPAELEETEIIDYEKDHLKGWAFIRKTSKEDREFWMLTGHMACGGGANTLAIITICYDNPNDKTWAVEMFQSVSHPVSSGGSHRTE